MGIPDSEVRQQGRVLKVAAIGAESVVVSTLAIASWNVAFGHGGPVDWLAGAPILTVVGLECLRLPIAFKLGRMTLLGGACSVALLAGLTVITGEAASVAFENLIFQRSRPVVEAEAAAKRAEIDLAALKGARDRAEADVEAARRHRSDIDRPVALQPVPAALACKGRKGQATWNCGGPQQAAVVAANAATMRAHDAELLAASEAVRAAEGRLRASPGLEGAEQSVAEVKRAVADARAQNPMFRVAAAWMKTPVEDLTSAEFETVKGRAVIALAVATALSTALAAVISVLPERGQGKPSKLVRAMRRLIAAWRRKIRRYEPTIMTRFRDRVVYVPCDPATGQILNSDDPSKRAAA